FLNCCYLGQIDRTPSTNMAVNKLASSIAGELIRKGVRAVVAAGWPVQDDAALCFAETFYQALLNGQSFGQALKRARYETWDQHGESNTWGAYQAYGDPDFCLTSSEGRGHSDDGEETVAAEEVLIELEGLSAHLNQAEEAEARIALSRIEKKCAADWLNQGNVQERLGAAYAECGLFKEAVAHYKQAVESEDPANPAPLRSIEQWINLAVRCGEHSGDSAMIEDALNRGEHLLAIAKTPERLSIMGSAYKNLAQLEPDPAQARSRLEQAAAYYHEAAERQRQEGAADPYPILNALVLEALIGKRTEDELEPLLAACEGFAQQRFCADRITWDAVTVADVALIRALVRHALPQEQERLVLAYRSAFVESSANQKEQNSALMQMRFMRAMLTKMAYSDRKVVASVVESLDQILKQLQPPEQATGSSANQAKEVSTKSSRRPGRATPAAKQFERKKSTRKKVGPQSTGRKGKAGKRRPSLLS
ncbi:MAG TPA: CHAT domain-containing protein, partial [Nitrospira sp.]|nr:CHAT domain-containing protein [Nitrospira sp.]